MPMPPYTIYCYERGCRSVAVYKIAARWSDGITSELKTYGLVCAGCLAKWFQSSLEKQARCRRAPRETLDTPGIYLLASGQRDVQLQRLAELEARLLAEADATEPL